MRRALVLVCILSSCFASAQTAQSCEKLARLALPHVRIAQAQYVAAGAMSLPKGEPPATAPRYKSLPAFCRVQAVSNPSADSDIPIEVWLPAANWNGRFLGLGNGGFAGSIGYAALARVVRDGYAAASTDTGHRAGGTDASWALGHPQKVIDFGYRAIHEMTVVGEAVSKAFYSNAVQHAYFSSCSNGGRQALMEAQRYPADYDGIIAWAPANYWTHLLTSAISGERATTEPSAAYIPATKLPAIAGAVNKACDAKDGVSDGVINDPRTCHFNPAVLKCTGGDTSQCLTEPEISAVKKLYEGARDAKGHLIYPGLLPGSEAGDGGWKPWITGDAPGKSLMFDFGNGYFSNMVYGKPGWDSSHPSLDELVRAADEKTGSILNSTDPNLQPFKARGGKLIIYHGWDDPAISALNSINYYGSVVARMGQNSVHDFLRLYMVPGMQHCGGGPGATNFGQNGTSLEEDPQHDVQHAVEQWVEKGAAPDAIVAFKPASGNSPRMTRPLCPYPQEAKYLGKGDTNSAESFKCAAPAGRRD